MCDVRRQDTMAHELDKLISPCKKLKLDATKGNEQENKLDCNQTQTADLVLAFEDVKDINGNAHVHDGSTVDLDNVNVSESKCELNTDSNVKANESSLHFTKCMSSHLQEIKQASSDIENHYTEQTQNCESKHLHKEIHFCEKENVNFSDKDSELETQVSRFGTVEKCFELSDIEKENVNFSDKDSELETQVSRFGTVEKCFELSDIDEVCKGVEANASLNGVLTDTNQLEHITKIVVEVDIAMTIAHIDSKNDVEICLVDRCSSDRMCEKAKTCLYPNFGRSEDILERLDKDMKTAHGNPCIDYCHDCRLPLLETYEQLELNRSTPLCTSTTHTKCQCLHIKDMNIMNGEYINKKFLKACSVPAVRSVDIMAVEENMDSDCHFRVKSDNTIAEHVERSKSMKSAALKKNIESKQKKMNRNGTKKEKFVEYMGPGLTVGSNDNYVVDASKTDFVKSTDIETCTLIEYKGFGLTSPLPLKSNTPCPLTSTPCPKKSRSRMFGTIHNAQSNVQEILKVDHEKEDRTLTKCVLYEDAIIRPPSTEGMLHPKLGQNIELATNYSYGQDDALGCEQSDATRNNSESKYPCHNGDNINSAPFLTKYMSEQLKRYLSSLPVLKPQLHSLDCLHLPTNKSSKYLTLQPNQICLIDKPINSAIICPKKPCSVLLPDEEYPNVTRRSNIDKSSNTSSAYKYDKSGGKIASKLLQCFGHLKISAYMNFGLLTVHVVQARQLSTKRKSTCDSFVKLTLIPDDGKKTKCKSKVLQNSNNPLYDEKFSFELNEKDHSKRLLISVWHKDQIANLSEFLGCMSFGICHLINPKKKVSGWFYLLTEDIGHKKHLQVTHQQRLQLKNLSNIPSVNKDICGTETLTFTLHRGKNGFGFSVVEACPVKVGRIDQASPSQSSGLQPGDMIVRLNKQNVSRSTATSVAKLIKNSCNALIMEIQRPRPMTFEHLESSPCKSMKSEGSILHGDIPEIYNAITDNCTAHTVQQMLTHNGDDNCRDHTVSQMITLNSDDKENGIPDYEAFYPASPNTISLATSTPLPYLATGHRTVPTCEARKQEAVHQLLNLELDFIDLMHAGMQCYSRPLRHCILSNLQHNTLFQNIEKLTTISEYHVKQMHDNIPPTFMSEDNTDGSASSVNHNFFQSIGFIYQSKVHMLCQAYDLYAKGISSANQLLSDLHRKEDFVKFVQDPPLQDVQWSISAFISRPVQHICDLYRVLQEVFLNTDTTSPDFSSLKQVAEGLQECVMNITNYSCQHAQSLLSVASKESKVSFTISMKSKSSSASCASGSSKGSSLQTNKSVDQEILRIQDRLIFASYVPIFQLCQDDRHLIFSAEVYKWEWQQWYKISMFLFSDMLLQIVKEPDGYLQVIQEPIMLIDVCTIQLHGRHSTEFVISYNVKASTSGKTRRKLCLRASSTEQKCAWKSLIEQRVTVLHGRLECYSSMNDVSSGSAAAVIL